MKRYIAALMCLLLLTACAPHAAPEKTEGITFTDALDRTVTVQKNPVRTAVLLGSFADVWVHAGGTLCAAAEDAWDNFGLEQGDAISLGGAHSPNLELLLSAQPDFVIASASTTSHVSLCASLEAAGIPTAYFDVDNFYDYLEMLKRCTQITGREDLFEENGQALLLQIDAVKQRYAQLDLPEAQRTVLLLRISSGGVKAKGSNGTVLGEMLADMGLVNIADHDTHLLEDLSIEAILRAQPQHIFIVPMGSDEKAAQNALESMIRENPAWHTLEAVRAGRLHQMDKTLFNLKPNTRWALAYQELYETLTE